ncbi:hypothetical protein B0H19DRAFT_1367687 [Mycena capillaripes]|nr:hypothetical protein B0H19DRAFT_1367687 [Mycena capillaripes]
MPAPAPNALSVVLGILRLSHKYDVQYLYRRALKHLAVDGWYTLTYEDIIGVGEDHLVNGISPVHPRYSLQVIRAVIEELLPFLGGDMGPHVGKALAAHRHLVLATIAITRFLTVYDPCGSANTCDAARKSALSDFLDDLTDMEGQLIPHNVAENTLGTLTSLGICTGCRDRARSRIREAASAFWDELPGIFELQPWEELHAMERTAMGEE